jgi:hypothetical protein
MEVIRDISKGRYPPVGKLLRIRIMELSKISIICCLSLCTIKCPKVISIDKAVRKRN